MQMKAKLAMLAFVPFFNASIAAAGGSPPVDAGLNLDWPAGAGCDFPINIRVSGKASFISLPGDRLIITAPNQRVTVTNRDDPANSITFVATSTARLSTDANGNLVVVANGRSLLQDPVANILVFVIGSFSFEISGLTDLTGTGQLTDVCALIE